MAFTASVADALKWIDVMAKHKRLRGLIMLALLGIPTAACAKGTGRPGASAAAGSQETPRFTIGPNTRVCVWVVADDNIPDINHAGRTDKVLSSDLAGDLEANLQGALQGTNRVARMVRQHSNEIVSGCEPAANPIYVRMRYSLNAAGNPLLVRWVVFQGSVKIERTAERDLRKELAAGVVFDPMRGRPAAAMLTEDMIARAKDIALVLDR